MYYEPIHPWSHVHHVHHEERGETTACPLTVTSRGSFGLEMGCLSLKSGVRCEREFWKGENVSVGPCGGGVLEIRSHSALQGLNFVHARSEMGYIVI